MRRRGRPGGTDERPEPASALRSLLGAVVLGIAPFLDWSASGDLGHRGTALDVPVRFLWADGAVRGDPSLGHVLLGFALVGAVGAVAPVLRPLATGAGAAILVALVWYLVRFSVVTAIVVPLRALGPGLALAALGGVLLATSR